MGVLVRREQWTKSSIRLLPLVREVDRPRIDDQVTTEIHVCASRLWYQEAQRITTLRHMLLQPYTQRCTHVFRALRNDDIRQPLIPMIRPFVLGEFGPRVDLPIPPEHHKAK